MKKRYNLGPVKPDCIFKGCDRPQYGHELCEAHNQQRIRGTGLKPIRRYGSPNPKTCDECDDGAEAVVSTSGRPLCRKHHARWLRHGDSAKRSRNDLRPLAMIMIENWIADRDRSECWTDWANRPEWSGYDGGGAVTRGYPTLGRDRVMRLVLIASGRPVPPAPGNHGLHNCDNKLCLNPDHLRWGTHRENMGDLQAVRNYCKHCTHCNPE